MQNLIKYIRNLVLTLTVATTIISCKKSFLEIVPKGRVIAAKTSDYDLLLNNLSLVNFSGNSQILSADEITMVEPGWTGATFREKQLFKWEPDVYAASEDAAETLDAVKSLYIYNKVIAEVPDAKEGSAAANKALEAEALAGRAWVNFMLVNFYGKPYNEATAATDPGFPLIMKADVNASNFTRNTVQEVYDQILTDLNTAIPNLVSDGVTHRIRMSKSAAQAILAKVYIFMGRFSEALPLLDESISNLPKSQVTTGLVNYNTAFQGFPTVVNDLENVYAKNMSDSYLSTSGRLVYITPETAALFGPTDTRLTRLFASITLTNGLKLYRRMGTTTYNIGVRVPELYLLRAEVKARLNNLSGAAADLLTLRQNRMPAANAPVTAAVASDKMALLNFVMEERIREFTVAGYRWFDMRRLSVDPLFTMPAYRHRVYNAAGIVSETYTLKPERLVFRFSPKVLAENPNLQNNP